MKTTITERILLIMKEFGDNANSFSAKIGVTRSTISTAIERNKGVNSELLEKIINVYPSINGGWLLTGKGEMKKKELAEIKIIETRPRIPLNAVAGSLSVALSGVTGLDCEELPFIQAFANYNYTILVKGDSMEPEFHSGDELACLALKGSNYIQWGRYHALDTAQGVLVKRIYDKGDHIVCKSDNDELYPDFKIHKEEIYNLGLVIGMLRRY